MKWTCASFKAVPLSVKLSGIPSLSRKSLKRMPDVGDVSYVAIKRDEAQDRQLTTPFSIQNSA